MIKKKTEDKILDVSASMQGSLVFSDPVNLRINGKFNGNLTTRGNLIIGESADVDADIIGESITISGVVRGNIKATRMIIMTNTAQVNGDIETGKFSIEEGAVFNGHCKMSHQKLSLAELSSYLAVEEDKIKEWVSNGKIPVEKEGGKLLFDRRQVEAWIGSN